MYALKSMTNSTVADAGNRQTNTTAKCLSYGLDSHCKERSNQCTGEIQVRVEVSASTRDRRNTEQYIEFITSGSVDQETGRIASDSYQYRLNLSI